MKKAILTYLSITIALAYVGAGFQAPAGAKDASSAGKLQQLTFKEFKCTITAPNSFELNTKDTSVGRMFVLVDPARDKQNYRALSVSIVPDANGDLPGFVDGILAPYHEGLKDYKEETLPPQMIDGHKFAAKKYSGAFPKTGTPNVGCVYATLENGTYFALIASCNGKEGANALPQLLDAIKTFHISK